MAEEKDYNKITVEKDILKISIDILKKEKQNLSNYISIIRKLERTSNRIGIITKSVIRHRQLKRAIGTIESLL
jgi:hypothetical protein